MNDNSLYGHAWNEYIGNKYNNIFRHTPTTFANVLFILLSI